MTIIDAILFASLISLGACLALLVSHIRHARRAARARRKLHEYIALSLLPRLDDENRRRSTALGASALPASFWRQDN